MSFSGEIKEEISRQIPAKSHCLRAEIAAMIQFAGSVSRKPDGETILVETENVGFAKKYLRLLKKEFGIQVDLEIRRRPGGKTHQYAILVGETKAAQQLIAHAVIDSPREDMKRLLKNSCCRRAYIRG